MPEDIKTVAAYFNETWHDYKTYVADNRLCHQELFATLNNFLQEHMENRPFSFVDVGCGDGSSIAPILQQYHLKKYIGIDIANDVLKTAPTHLAQLDCEKEFIFDDMTHAIKHIRPPIDVIFSSYTVHHLSYQDKVDFIYNCKNKLVPGGFFIMVDGILEENQTRDEWLIGYEEYYKTIYPGITQEELDHCLKHPRTSDFPEHISTFEKIAQTTKWANFQVLAQIGLLTFMVYRK